MEDGGGTTAIRYSPSLPEWFQLNRFSLAVSSYQSGNLLLLSGEDDRMVLRTRPFDVPMALAYDGATLLVSSRDKVWFFENTSADPNQAHFEPQKSLETGSIDCHGLGFRSADILAISTRLSCISRITPSGDFQTDWQPSFISQIAPEDRCHLNGMALRSDGAPSYVTALGATDVRAGWRANRLCGGVMIDVLNDQIVVDGLAMPHSPRVAADGSVYFLEAAAGRLVRFIPADGRTETVATAPGFARGLDLVGHHAVMALSRPRADKLFSNMPIAAHAERLCCGVLIIDLQEKQIIGVIEFIHGCREVFDVLLISDILSANVVSPC